MSLLVGVRVPGWESSERPWEDSGEEAIWESPSGSVMVGYG